ncbi:hypothetical protein BRC19_03310 [Candidatus Saccharibacteria bacterium QS_5_54_17]|nr:MAG: hypothetical protein BRC19_03310 [Candidatus Saccharibacteria bacterium QS_5_54_17]
MADENLLDPPIKEALIDIRTSQEDVHEYVETFHEKIIDNFPEKQIKRELSVSLSKKSEEEKHDLSQEEAVKGYAFKSLDGSEFVQVDNDGFTFSFVGDYEGWSKFINLFKPLWEDYVDTMQPDSISRIGVRFINKIDIPRSKTLDDYIVTLPRTKDDKSFVLREMFMRLVFPDKNNENNIGILTEAINPKEVTEKSIPFIMDVDVFCEEIFSIDYDAMSSKLEELRTYKNQIFFSSITDEAIGKFKEKGK